MSFLRKQEFRTHSKRIALQMNPVARIGCHPDNEPMNPVARIGCHPDNEPMNPVTFTGCHPDNEPMKPVAHIGCHPEAPAEGSRLRHLPKDLAPPNALND